MVSNRQSVVVKYKLKDKRFDLNGVSSLALPEEKEEKLNQLFNDFSNETAFKRLSSDTFVKASLILLIVFIVLLVFFVVIQTFSPTKHLLTELDHEEKPETTEATTEVTPEDGNERLLAGDGGFHNANIIIDSSSPVVFEVFIFLTTYIIALLLIALTIQQILIKNLVPVVNKYERETISIYEKHFQNHLIIQPRRKRRAILGCFMCFNVFEFSYLLISQIDQEKENLSGKSTGELDDNEEYQVKDDLVFVTE